MRTKTIKQKVFFKASPREVYEALMDSSKHSEFTESNSLINPVEGGNFTAYDGWIEGVNIKLKPYKQIVQKWRGDDWPERHYSIATFDLKDSENGTLLSFTQTDVPMEHYEDIDKGWVEHYWVKMKKMLEK